MEITPDMIAKIAPYCNRQLAAELCGPLNQYLTQYGINTLLRLDHFFGQAAEESDSFKTLREYASGNEYEGRRDLGNTQPGDGPRYKGRGIFQLTGRANYTQMSSILGVDLVNQPELAETPEIAVRTACEYWKTRGLERYADADDIQGMTRHINGGLNGLAQRDNFTTQADAVFSPFFPG